jgi:hypothetical protein
MTTVDALTKRHGEKTAVSDLSSLRKAGLEQA